MEKTLSGSGADSIFQPGPGSAPLTMTTSSGGESALTMDEPCTETVDEGPLLSVPRENRWYLKAAIIVVVNLFATYFLCYWMLMRQDGMQRVDWVPQEATVNGKPSMVFIPIFMRHSDLANIKIPEERFHENKK